MEDFLKSIEELSEDFFVCVKELLVDRDEFLGCLKDLSDTLP